MNDNYSVNTKANVTDIPEEATAILIGFDDYTEVSEALYRVNLLGKHYFYSDSDGLLFIQNPDAEITGEKYDVLVAPVRDWERDPDGDYLIYLTDDHNQFVYTVDKGRCFGYTVKE